MKLPLSLIKSFLDIELGVVEIEETLSMLGIEVDKIFAPRPSFTDVIVAEVKGVRRHENAEKLRVAEVFDGEKTWQVVCGAPNCRAGLKVAFARPGARLMDEEGKTRVIEKASIRGVESFGMLCSASELNLYEDANGILELPVDFPTGADCVALLWDPVFEISLTPNLGHCMSALGVARELAAALKKPLKGRARARARARARVVEVQARALCPRYMACIVENVTVGSSPFWLQRQLLTAGLRPINNVVDVTNYLLLKTGQPLHAFDYDKIEGGKVCVRTAIKTESFTALTGQECEIPAGALVIADAKKIVAVAGVMGGANSAVSETTRTILLEAAHFNAGSVRATAKKMGLRTESSLRFERGIDPAAVPTVLEEAAALIAELTSGSADGGLDDCEETPFQVRAIALRPARVNQILGTKLSHSEIQNILERLQCSIKKEGETFIVEVPSFRNDLSQEIDLVEEVARIYGYNHIERPLPRATTSQIPNDPEYLFTSELRTRLVALGLQEFLTCDLISPKLASLVQEVSLSQKTLFKTLHSKSEEYSILRPSLLPGLLQVARTNLDRKNQQFAAFEIGRIHFLDKTRVEFPMLALLLSGKAAPQHWDRKVPDVDFFDLKGFIDNLLQGLPVSCVPSAHPSFHPGRQADLIANNLCIGSFGELHPNLLSKFDIKQRLYYAELNASQLQAIKTQAPKFQALAQFPSSERDWTLLLGPKMHSDRLFSAIRSAKSTLLERFEVLDLYRTDDGANITLRFVYRDASKTMSFEEVETEHTRLIHEVLAKTSLSS